MTISVCRNFEYYTEPQAETTDITITTTEGSDIEISSEYKIKSPNAVVKSTALIKRLESIPGISDVKYGFRRFTYSDGTTSIDTFQDHSGRLTVSIKKGENYSAEKAVSNIFQQIYQLLDDHGEHTRRVEMAAENYAVSRFENDR